MKLLWWQRLIKPTLVGRLFLVQMLMLVILWTLLVSYAIFESRHSKSLLDNTNIYDLIVNVSENLADQPARRLQTLHMINRALQENQYLEDIDSVELRPVMIVRQDNTLIYQSDTAPSEAKIATFNVTQDIYANGREWRARSVQSANSNTNATIMIPVDAWDLAIHLNSHAYFLLPLLISLPFLWLPAWLSIRFGLRPWNKVVHEVAARGAHNLTPLSFKPKHAELSAMSNSINALLQRVDTSVARERSFITDATHELRTPLAAMRINVEALQSQSNDLLQRELLDGILNSSKRATRLVNQLLLLMRSDSTHSMPLHNVALDVLLQDRLAELSLLANQRQIELELTSDSHLFIRGQRESLESLIDNLIENAIKYSPPHTSVIVDLQRRANQAVLSISDHGSGIAPELYERVFDRFFRAADQTQNGSGLGLAIAKAVVLQHGGSISLQANDPGIRVNVILPLVH